MYVCTKYIKNTFLIFQYNNKMHFLKKQKKKL